MVEDVLRLPMMGGSYLEVLDCLGAALVVLLGGVINFSTVDAFGMVLETGLTLVLMNLNGAGGTGALREPIDSNRSFPVMSTFNIILAALETLRTMLDFRSRVSCFGFYVANLWLGDLYDHICYEFSKLLGCETKCLICGFRLRESVLPDC